jgi:hypothetical protein
VLETQYNGRTRRFTKLFLGHAGPPSFQESKLCDSNRLEGTVVTCDPSTKALRLTGGCFRALTVSSGRYAPAGAPRCSLWRSDSGDPSFVSGRLTSSDNFRFARHSGTIAMMLGRARASHTGIRADKGLKHEDKNLGEPVASRLRRVSRWCVVAPKAKDGASLKAQ